VGQVRHGNLLIEVMRVCSLSLMLKRADLGKQGRRSSIAWPFDLLRKQA